MEKEARIELITKNETPAWDNESNEGRAVFYAKQGATTYCLSEAIFKKGYGVSEMEKFKEGYYKFFGSDWRGYEGWGIVLYDGTLIVPPLYDSIGKEGEDFKAYYQNLADDYEAGDIPRHGWALIDKWGKILVRPGEYVPKEVE